MVGGVSGPRGSPSGLGAEEWANASLAQLLGALASHARGYIAAGESVVVLTRYLGRGKASGVEVDAPGAHLWRMRNGKAVRLEIFSSRERVLDAAGL